MTKNSVRDVGSVEAQGCLIDKDLHYGRGDGADQEQCGPVGLSVQVNDGLGELTQWRRTTAGTLNCLKTNSVW